KFAKEHEEPLHEVGFVPYFEEIKVDYEPGTTQDIQLADGSHILLKKLGHEYDPRDRNEALALLHKAQTERLFMTGLLYHQTDTRMTLAEQLNLADTPLAHMKED